MNWTAKEGYDMHMEFPRSTCKDKTVKGFVGCCGVLKFCDKKLKKDKKEDDGNDSKIALEIKKVRKKQKENNKNKGD